MPIMSDVSTVNVQNTTSQTNQLSSSKEYIENEKNPLTASKEEMKVKMQKIYENTSLVNSGFGKRDYILPTP